MRKKVRKSLAFLLALALVVSVMSGLGLSVSADEAQNEPVAAAAEGEQTTPVEETPKAEEKEEKTAEPAAEPEKKDEEKAEGEGSGAKTAEKQDETTPKAGENVQTATIGTGDKTVTVKTTAAAGVLPEGAKLVVKKLANQDQAYQDAESTLKDSQVTYDDFLALDVGFEVNGKEVEPEAGSVQVQFELGAGLLPETVDTSTLAVQHLTDGKAETVADVGAVTAGDVTVKNETIKADFEVKSFSTFTITWDDYCTITAHYVDESDKEINPSTVNQVISSDNGNFTKTVTFASDKNYALTFNGYNYKEAYIIVDGVKKTVTRMEISVSGKIWSRTRTVTFYNNDTEVAKHTYRHNTITDDLYLVYAADATIGGPGGSITDQKKLSHDKYVEAKDDGTYDLSLTVSGAKGSKTDKAKLDILLIVDKSRSMRFPMDKDLEGNNPQYPALADQRITKVANAANSLITALDAKKDVLDVNYSVVTFNGPTSSGAGEENDASVSLNWSESSTGVAGAITSPTPNGATNYQAAIRKAKTQLNQARPDAQKVVIFLTDGKPTVRIGGGTGTGDDGSNINAAIGEISNMWTDYFYCVGAGPAFKDDNATNQTAYQNLVNLKDKVHATNKGVYRATSTEALNKIFTDMSANITNLYCDHVTVTDELSDNVQLVESASGTPKDLIVTVKKGDKDGQVVVTGPKEVSFDGVTISAKYEDGKIKLIFPETYTLNPDYTYIVTANIEATEKAYQRVRENGGQYPEEGGKGTGTTSEGQGGVFTNTKADVTYTYNDVKTTEGYNNPVIQPKPAKLTIKKTIVGLTEEEINSALENNLTFDITYTYPTGATENAKTETDQVKLGAVTKNDDGTYTYTYTNDKVWSMSAKYSVTESKYNVDNYDCTVTPGKTQKGDIPKYGEATATFTNAYTPSDRTITLKKVVDGNMGDTKKTFHFTATNATITGDGNLADGKTTTITAKVGDTVTITEDDYTSDGYTTTAAATEGVNGEYKDHSYTFTVTKEMDENTIITFTNTKEIQPPNGITTNATPYIIMVVLAAGAAVYFVYSRRRRNG